MTYLLWACIGILFAVLSAMGMKIYFMKKAAREITAQFAEKLAEDTNTLISVSCRDKHMRQLASDISAGSAPDTSGSARAIWN